MAISVVTLGSMICSDIIGIPQENIIVSRESRLPIGQIASVTPSGSNGAGDTSTSNPWKLHLCFFWFFWGQIMHFTDIAICVCKTSSAIDNCSYPGRWAMLVVQVGKDTTYMGRRDIKILIHKKWQNIVRPYMFNVQTVCVCNKNWMY